MPKPPAITAKKLVKLLNKQGFVLDRQKGSHQIFLHPKTRKRAVVPMHNKDLPIGTLLSILKTSGLRKEDLN